LEKPELLEVFVQSLSFNCLEITQDL
jgi:hypothetical protein